MHDVLRGQSLWWMECGRRSGVVQARTMDSHNSQSSLHYFCANWHAAVRGCLIRLTRFAAQCVGLKCGSQVSPLYKTKPISATHCTPWKLPHRVCAPFNVNCMLCTPFLCTPLFVLKTAMYGGLLRLDW